MGRPPKMAPHRPRKALNRVSHAHKGVRQSAWHPVSMNRRAWHCLGHFGSVWAPTGQLKALVSRGYRPEPNGELVRSMAPRRATCRTGRGALWTVALQTLAFGPPACRLLCLLRNREAHPRTIERGFCTACMRRLKTHALLSSEGTCLLRPIYASESRLQPQTSNHHPNVASLYPTTWRHLVPVACTQCGNPLIIR